MRAGFWGTAEETWFVSRDGRRCWLVQSPDMIGAQLAVSAERPAEGARELRWDACGDLHALSRGLEKMGPAGPVSDSFLFESGPECVFVSKSKAVELAGEGEDLGLGSLEVGEAAQCWTREVTVTRLA